MTFKEMRTCKEAMNYYLDGTARIANLYAKEIKLDKSKLEELLGECKDGFEVLNEECAELASDIDVPTWFVYVSMILDAPRVVKLGVAYYRLRNAICKCGYCTACSDEMLRQAFEI